MKKMSDLYSLSRVIVLLTLVDQKTFGADPRKIHIQEALELLNKFRLEYHTRGFSQPAAQKKQAPAKDEVAGFIFHFKSILRLKNGVSKETTPPLQ